MSMRITIAKYILFVIFVSVSAHVWGQKEERINIRKGNKLFADSTFVEAETRYRLALDVNPNSAIARYNLGNVLLSQHKPQEAMEQFTTALQLEKDKSKQAQIFHNMGVLHHQGNDYTKAIDAYKEALRRNPADDETRYNLVLAQKKLKEQQQQQQQQQNQQEQKKENQNQEKQKNQEKEQQDNRQQAKNDSKPQMSKENAEQLLRSVLQDEKNVQDKVKKQQRIIDSGRLEKDW